MTDHATIRAHQDAVDHAARQAEAKWGVGRLGSLVSVETATKFMRQQNRWQAALQAAWNERPPIKQPTEDTLRAAAGGMQRAWAALDKEATDAGHSPLQPTVWEVALKDGTVAAFVQTTAEAIKVRADGRYRVIYTVAEIGNVIDALGVVGEGKILFPGSTIEPVRILEGAKTVRQRGDFSWVREGDEIPFGVAP